MKEPNTDRPQEQKQWAPAPSLERWKQVGSKRIGDFRIFSLREDQLVSPRTGEPHGFYVLETPDWVNVIALTAANELVMVEQYRHGSETVELEIPGGMIDPHDASPVDAGVRELREETGFAGKNARLLGEVFPNPAIMRNTCHTVLVEDCTLQHALQLDHGEDLATRLVPIDGIPDLIHQGRIRHCLVVTALFYFDLWRRGLTDPR